MAQPPTRVGIVNRANDLPRLDARRPRALALLGHVLGQDWGGQYPVSR